MKKRNNFLKCIGIVFAVLLLLMLCGCSKETSQKNAAITLPEQKSSSAGQAGAIFAPSTEFISADAAGDASGRFLVGDDGIIPTQLIQYDLEAQQKTAFCYQPALDGARDVALSSAATALDGSLWALVCRFWRADDGESLTTDFTVERLDAD